MMLDLSQLSVFKAVAQLQSFTKAAEHLLISQPAVSKQIATLERNLGVKLIERGSRQMLLTEPGRLLFGYAQRIADLATEARTAMSDLSALRRGVLRIGATPTIGTYLLPESLVYFRQRFPALELSVQIQDAATLRHRLIDGGLDVVLTPQFIEDAALRAEPFMTDRIAAVCTPAYPLLVKGQITLLKLKSERLIARSASANSVGFVERMLQARGCHAERVMRLPHTESVKQAALAGLGIGFVPEMAIKREIENGSLRAVTIKQFVVARPAYWLERATESRSKAAHAYWCILKHAVRGSLRRRS